MIFLGALDLFEREETLYRPSSCAFHHEVDIILICEGIFKVGEKLVFDAN
jgi:hypothetical protein